MITNFTDENAEAIFKGEYTRKLPREIQRTALKKLRQLHAAGSLNDLRIPPGNRLEALKNDRAGQHSIRINDQWRVVFVWRDGNAYDVAIVDYH